MTCQPFAGSAPRAADPEPGHCGPPYRGRMLWIFGQATGTHPALEKMRKVLLAKQPIRLEAPIPEDGDSSCG